MRTKRSLRFPERTLDADQSLIGRQRIQIDAFGEVDTARNVSHSLHALGSGPTSPIAVSFHALFSEVCDFANGLIRDGPAIC